MEVIKTAIDGVVIIEPRIFEDARGYFFESFSQREFNKCDEFYHPEADGGISILDDSLGIDWRIPTEHALLSEKDTKHPLLKDLVNPFVLGSF
jgi:dTDP-4-dehydrorhamnose 3,5-epimerase